jgi:hypothetical protein
MFLFRELIPEACARSRSSAQRTKRKPAGVRIHPTSRMMSMMQPANPAMFPEAPQGPQLDPGEQKAVGESLQNVAKGCQSMW